MFPPAVAQTLLAALQGATPSGGGEDNQQNANQAPGVPNLAAQLLAMFSGTGAGMMQPTLAGPHPLHAAIPGPSQALPGPMLPWVTSTQEMQAANVMQFVQAFLPLLAGAPPIAPILAPAVRAPVPVEASDTFELDEDGLWIDKPRKQEQFDKVPYWTRNSYKNQPPPPTEPGQKKRKRGPTRMSKNENVRMRYVFTPEGIMIDGLCARQMRMALYQFCAYLDGKGMLPETWARGIDPDCEIEYYRFMRRRFRECQCCDNNWIAREIALRNYSLWKKRRDERKQRQAEGKGTRRQKAKKVTRASDSDAEDDEEFEEAMAGLGSQNVLDQAQYAFTPAPEELPTSFTTENMGAGTSAAGGTSADQLESSASRTPASPSPYEPSSPQMTSFASLSDALSPSLPPLPLPLQPMPLTMSSSSPQAGLAVLLASPRRSSPLPPPSSRPASPAHLPPSSSRLASPAPSCNPSSSSTSLTSQTFRERSSSASGSAQAERTSVSGETECRAAGGDTGLSDGGNVGTLDGALLFVRTRGFDDVDIAIPSTKPDGFHVPLMSSSAGEAAVEKASKPTKRKKAGAKDIPWPPPSTMTQPKDVCARIWHRDNGGTAAEFDVFYGNLTSYARGVYRQTDGKAMSKPKPKKVN